MLIDIYLSFFCLFVAYDAAIKSRRLLWANSGKSNLGVQL